MFMEKIKTLINDSQLNLSTLIDFTKAEHKIHNLEYSTIKESGLTNTQFGVLEVLYSKGDLRIGEIMEKILTTSKYYSCNKKFRKRRIYKKIPDPLDKRSTIISITDKGIDVIEEILPKHINNINNIFSILTDEEKVLLRNILKKFKQL